MKRTTKVSLLTTMLVMGLAISLGAPGAKAATQTQINNAIANGLANLASRQNIDGHWGADYFVANTATAVLAFENAGFHAGDGSIYATNVQKGLDYLFSTAIVQTIGVQPAGNPDTNGNGFGIYFNDPWNQVVYHTPMVLMAIVASETPSAVTITGPANVIGRSYSNIVQDTVDWLAWGQSDATNNRRGGWRYSPNSNDADNSLSQWPVLGLEAAELWGINAPAFVKSELAFWVAADQNLSGDPTSNYYYGCFDYQPGYGLNTIAETAAGIIELTYLGASKTDPRIVAAEGYINRDWGTTSGWRVNLGNFYAMYAVMKAARLALPTPIQFISNYDGTPGVEWYNGTNQYADLIVTNQYGDGHWAQWVAPEYAPQDLCTAWGVIILLPYVVVVQYDLTVNVVNSGTNTPITGATVTLNGPESRTGTTNGGGVAEFLNLQAGSYTIDVSASGYNSASATLFLNSDATITVRLTPTGQPPGVPEFGFSATIITSLAAVVFLALRKRYGK